MLETVLKLQQLQVPKGRLGVMFMGQAGFILKSSAGQLMGIDLYLSDACNRYFGFKRLMPRILSPSEIHLQYIVASHAHYDHFDPDSIPELLANEDTKLLMARDCIPECERLGITESRYSVLEKGKQVSAGDFEVLPVPCDHGLDTPDALGIFVKSGEKRFYLVGDSCYREDYARSMKEMEPDFAAAPINGAFGNMNSEEAAKFFSILRPGIAMPCHYWNFAEHHGDPGEFIIAMKERVPNVRYLLMAPGETLII